jgi:hypothetical protein
MNRLFMVMMSVFVAIGITACGESSEEKTVREAAEKKALENSIRAPFQSKAVKLHAKLMAAGADKQMQGSFEERCISALENRPAIESSLSLTFSICESVYKKQSDLLNRINQSKEVINALVDDLKSKGINTETLTPYIAKFEAPNKHIINWEFNVKQAKGVYDRALQEQNRQREKQEKQSAFIAEMGKVAHEEAILLSIEKDDVVKNATALAIALKENEAFKRRPDSIIETAVKQFVGHAKYSSDVKPVRIDDQGIKIIPIGGFKWNDDLYDIIQKVKALNPADSQINFGRQSVKLSAIKSRDQAYKVLFNSNYGATMAYEIHPKIMLKNGQNVNVLHSKVDIHAEGIVINGLPFKLSIPLNMSAPDAIKSPHIVKFNPDNGIYAAYTAASISFKTNDEGLTDTYRDQFRKKMHSKYRPATEHETRWWHQGLSDFSDSTTKLHINGPNHNNTFYFDYQPGPRESLMKAYLRQHMAEMKRKKRLKSGNTGITL